MISWKAGSAADGHIHEEKLQIKSKKEKQYKWLFIAIAYVQSVHVVVGQYRLEERWVTASVFFLLIWIGIYNLKNNNDNLVP